MTKRGPVLIAPSILTADFGRLTEQIHEIEAAGGVDRIHVDVMDGVFVPNITMGPVIVSAIRRATALPLDVHLMIVEPGRYLATFVDAGANGLTIHVEGSHHLNRDLVEIRRLGARSGVALNPGTSPITIDSVLDDVDLVLVMSVNPGFGGQKLIRSAIGKIARIRAMLDLVSSPAELEVDGGISALTAPDAVRAGANVLVAGSAILQHPEGIAAGVDAIRRAIDV